MYTLPSNVTGNTENISTHLSCRMFSCNKPNKCHASRRHSGGDLLQYTKSEVPAYNWSAFEVLKQMTNKIYMGDHVTTFWRIEKILIVERLGRPYQVRKICWFVGCQFNSDCFMETNDLEIDRERKELEYIYIYI